MGENANQMESLSFTRMADGTAEEYAILLFYTKNTAMARRID